jgi:hypothetical protein
MAKKSRKLRSDNAAEAVEGAVAPRQPCPCGSGLRYKNCHGSAGGPRHVARPFAGLPGEAEIVALRELVPAATAPLSVKDSEREVRLCTLLPMAAPAMVRESGAIWLGLQVQHSYGDPARDLGAVLEAALQQTEPGIVGLTSAPGPGPRLQDLITNTTLDVTVHEGFGYWIDDVEHDAAMEAALEQANEAAMPTSRLTSVESAYWTNVGTKEHLRWVMTYEEDALVDALARLHVAGKDTLIEEGRLVGMFRAHGLVVPVWDLPVGTGPEVLEAPAAEFAKALADSIETAAPLTAQERSARAGLVNRQVTIR